MATARLSPDLAGMGGATEEFDEAVEALFSFSAALIRRSISSSSSSLTMLSLSGSKLILSFRLTLGFIGFLKLLDLLLGPKKEATKDAF